MKKLKYIFTLVLILSLGVSIGASQAYAAVDLTTKYRVYQNANVLKEFIDRNQAISYANNYADSYVEEIGTRKWVWSSFPKYQVYQYNIYIKSFYTLDAAKQEAVKWGNSTIVDIESKGWVSHNYPNYQLYQGDISLPHWKFTSLEAAQLEAKKWANSNIIDLRTNKWIWDNISDAKKNELRERPEIYRVYQKNYTKPEGWTFAYLEDAIKEALKWEHSYIVNTSKQNVRVFSNEKNYLVYQNRTYLDDFIHIEEAIEYAKLWANGKIFTTTNREIWTNSDYYQVVTEGQMAKGFQTAVAAQAYALGLTKAQVINYRDQLVWDNSTRLTYWAWHGSSTDENIKARVSETSGLDADSPSWFKLLDANGNFEDKSSPEIVRWLKNRDIEIHPLVTNQFSSSLTTAFLKNPAGQQKFIDGLVKRHKELGVHGINVDFESMRGSDRDAFTNFILNLTTAAHKENLIVSIDLPRGSAAWNHLTAFDHAQIADIVDFVVIMTYDHHYSGSTIPGSVAGMQWTEQGIVEFLSYGIPRSKLIMGIPFYIREWKLDSQGTLISNRAIHSATAKQIIASKNVVSLWDPKFNQFKVEYKEDGFTYIFWLEDENSVKARLDIAKKYYLAGVSAWRLGQEAPDVWATLFLEK